MRDVLVKVSAAFLRGARTSDGRPLRPRRLAGFDRYPSDHRVLREARGGDLFLAAVVDERLWVLGVLRRPVFDGAAWVAAPNVEVVVDATAFAPELRFESGDPLDEGDLAGSFRGPRVLAPAAAERLNDVVRAATADRPTRGDVEAAVVRVTAQVLGWTEAAVRADRGRWVAFHEDDGYDEDGGLDGVDWVALELRDEPSVEIYGRRDFDLRRTRFHSEAFRAHATTDEALRGLFAEQDGWLDGEQIAVLLAQKRLRRSALLDCSVDGCLRGDDDLVGAMTSLLMLRDFEDRSLEPGEFHEVDERWRGLLDGIPSPSLRGHVACFFQTAEAARCTGAYADDEPVEDAVASWSIGEGQGRTWLQRREADEGRPVPAFTRHTWLRKPPPGPGERPPADGRSDEIVSCPLSEVWAALDDEWVRSRLPGRTDEELAASLAAARRRDPQLAGLMGCVDRLISVGEARAALALAHACAAVVDPKRALLVEYHRGWALNTLRCWSEALEAGEEVLRLWKPGAPIPESYVHNNLAWSALQLGRLDLARRHAERAVELDPDNLPAAATRANVWFEQGEEKAARKEFARVMRAGVDPEPTRAVRLDAAWRALALKHQIPVEWTDEEESLFRAGA